MNTDQILEKRKEVIGLYKKNTRVMRIVEMTGLTWPTVNKVIKLYEAGKMSALQQKMGKTKGSGRILNSGQVEEIIGLYNKNTPVTRIVQMTGLSLPPVNKAIKLYELCEADGIDALQPKMGRTKGSGRILNPGQEEVIKNILYTKQPRDVEIIFFKGTYMEAPKEDDLIDEISDRLKQNLPADDLWEGMNKKLYGDYPQHLWCRDSVKVLIKIKTDVELSLRGVDKYLDRWGFPKKKQYQRLTANCSQIIQQWLKNNPPSDMGSEIYWLDRKRLATKKKQSIISATDKHQRVLWTVIQGNFLKNKQIEFLYSLSQQSRRRITVIRNDYKHYTSDQVKKWLAKNNITLYPPLLEGEATNIENDRERDRNAYEELQEEREQKREQKREQRREQKRIAKLGLEVKLKGQKRREETERERIKRERWVSKLVEEQVAKRDPYEDLNSGNFSTVTNAVNTDFDLAPDDDS